MTLWGAGVDHGTFGVAQVDAGTVCSDWGASLAQAIVLQRVKLNARPGMARGDWPGTGFGGFAYLSITGHDASSLTKSSASYGCVLTADSRPDRLRVLP